jgi:hypothetical protein
MVGSWVWKPGERTAIPASCNAIPSLAVSGVADGLDERPAGAAAIFVERSSFRGRCRELLGRDGDDGGSFLTTILGAVPELRVLEHVRPIQLCKDSTFEPLTLWEIVFPPLESSEHFDRLGKFLLVDQTYLTSEEYGRLRGLRWKEPRLGMFAD